MHSRILIKSNIFTQKSHLVRLTTFASRTCALLLFLLSVLFTSELQAQLNADFSVSVTKGCSPLQVSFTDKSTGNPTSWKWDVGNNATPFTLQNPSTTYVDDDGGVYTVRLIISDGVNSDTITKTALITVYGKPKPDFSAPLRSGCKPFTVSFSDLTQPAGTITEWNWTLGVGASTSQNPTITYANEGSYSVALAVKDKNGCVANTDPKPYITVTKQPLATFNVSPVRACEKPLTGIILRGDETGPFIFNWDINPKTGVPPGTLLGNPFGPFSINGTGQYSVTLTVSGAPGSGCSQTSTQNKVITIQKPQANFTFDKAACVGKVVKFTNTSMNAATGKYTWDFGNGTSTQDNPTFTFNAVGTYFVKLTARSEDGLCSHDTVFQVLVQQPVANFTQDIYYSCKSPQVVTFTNTSTGQAVTFNWSFGKTDKNPVHSFTSGTYNIILTASSSNGCQDTATSKLVISKPTARFTHDKPAGGCVPLDVKFTDTSISDSTITSWFWKFGDGTTSTLRNPSHIYTKDTTFRVTLIITNSIACVDSVFGSVLTGKKPVTDFVNFPVVVCGNNQPVYFTDSSKVDGKDTLIDFWDWRLTSRISNNQYSIENPVFINKLDTGWHDMFFISGYHGCLDTIIRPKAVFVYGPEIRTMFIDTICSNKVTFTANLMAYTSATWNFGDGRGYTHYNCPCRTIPPKDSAFFNGDPTKKDTIYFTAHDHDRPVMTHYYPDTSGSYTMVLTAYKQMTDRNPTNTADTVVDCVYVESYPIRIPDFRADIAYFDTVCFNNAIVLAPDTPGVDALQYEWFVDNVRVQNKSTTKNYSIPANTYGAAGNHIAKLVVHSTFCSDTATMRFFVSHPAPKISTINPPTGCAPLKVKFFGSDTSAFPAQQWLWNFGSSDANPMTFISSVPGTTNSPDSVTYNKAGDFQVTLETTDKFGCKARFTTATPIKVTSPVAKFNFISAAGCVGDTIRIVNTSTPDTSAGLKYEWTFDNGFTTTALNPKFYADTFELVKVKLKVTLSDHCVDSVTNSVIIDPKPKADFVAMGPTQSNCYPFVGVKFRSTTTPVFAEQTYRWDFGEGSTGNDDTSGTSYFEPGLYDIKLVVTTSNSGCKDSIIKDDLIVVRGPSAKFSISDSNVCIKSCIVFKISEEVNVDKYTWDFGDGEVVVGTAPPPADSIKHCYTATGTRTPVLILESGDCKVPKQKEIYVNDVAAKMKILSDTNIVVGTDTIFGCDTVRVLAKFMLDSAGKIDAFAWDYGDGSPNNSADTTTSKLFDSSPGLYKLRLMVSDNLSGCADTTFQMVRVYPAANAQAGSDVTLCTGDSVQLNGFGGVTYTWSPGTYLDRTDSSTVLSNPPVTFSYELRVVDDNGCTDIDSVTIFRDKTVVQFNITPDTACGSLTIQPTNTSNAKHYFWDFDSFRDTTADPTYTFTTVGKHFVSLTVYDLDSACATVMKDTVEVYAYPQLGLPNKQLICFGDSIVLNANVVGTPPYRASWTPGTGISDTNGLSVIAKPAVTTQYILVVQDRHCQSDDTVLVQVDQSKADFSLANNQACLNLALQITNNSIGNNYLWQFTTSPSDVSTNANPTFTYTNPGTYHIKLTVFDLDQQCAKTDTATVIIWPNPNLVVSGSGSICNYDSLLFKASGATNYLWTPASPDLSNPLSDQTYCTTDTAGTWYVAGSNTFGCTSFDSVTVIVHPDYQPNIPVDDTVVIGTKVYLDASANGANVDYSWTPVSEVTCASCPTTETTPLITTCYHIEWIDDKKCYPKKADFCIYVKEAYTIDVPNAFTPNGDGRNDKIYVRGFGIKKLLNFTIYNRWGEVVFETTDLNVGWDGVYKEKLQTDETYAYTVNAETFSGAILTKNGYITLLK